MNAVSLVNVTGSGLVGVVGVSMRLFGTLANEKINVILISQASSEHSICFAIESQYASQAKRAIESEFQYEIQSKEMEEVRVENGPRLAPVIAMTAPCSMSNQFRQWREVRRIWRTGGRLIRPGPRESSPQPPQSAHCCRARAHDG
jgi:predicted amino acid-binding ACT domain protein